MKYLKSYKIFESRDNQFFKTYEETKNWLDDMDIDNYTINDDLTIDGDGDVIISDIGLKKIPVKFKSVGGDFNCGSNQLTSLKGSPDSVGKGFYCGHNPIEEIYSLFGNKECIKWLNE